MQTKLTVSNGEASYMITIHTLGPPYTTGNEPLIWIENEGGEGMSMSEKNLYDILDKHFQSEF